LAACGPSDEIKESPVRPVKYAKVTKASQLETHTFSGLTVAENATNLSFKVGGRLKSVDVKLGDKVNKGQLIASIDPIDYSIQLQQAKAQVKGAEANMKSAESQLINMKASYKRLEKLYENNSVSLSDYQQAKAALASAESQYEASESQVNSAKRQVDAAKNQVDYSQLRAPFKGIISALQVESNEIIPAGNPIAILSSETDPQIEVGVPEDFISRLKPGQEVNIEIPSIPGESFTGKIEEISFASGTSVTYPVSVSIGKESKHVRPGMAADVHFYFSEKDKGFAEDRILAPVSAVGKSSEGHFVLVLIPEDNGNYKVEKRSVTVGKLLPQGFEMTSGVKENELIATAGLNTLLNGMEVKLLK